MPDTLLESHLQKLAAHAEWEWHFNQLADFAREHGHCNVSDLELRVWLRRQQQAATAEKLSSLHRQRLSDLGVTFEAQDDTWETNLQHLRAHLIRHRIPRDESRTTWLPTTPEEEDLATWLRSQRELHQEGLLSSGRERTLRALKLIAAAPSTSRYQPPSATVPPTSRTWDYRLQELQDYQRQHGHCDVPNRWPANTSLASWVADQRESHKKGRLIPERKAQLEAIGFTWHLGQQRSTRFWEARYAELVAFKEQHGHLHVHKVQHAQLWKWRGNQREARRNGTLSPERIAKLDAIGFVWDPKAEPAPPNGHMEQRWNQMFDQLHAYQAQHSHTRVPSEWPQNPQLSTWVSSQRENYSAGRLRPDRQARLEAIGFTWNVLQERQTQFWEARFAELVTFKDQHGHLRIDRDHQPRLWDWRGRQREARRNGTLSPERIARLNALGFEWNLEPNRQTQFWETRYAELVAFKEQHGHTNVPKKTHRQLWEWQRDQRLSRRNGTLPLEHRLPLNALGFEWE